MTDRSTIYKELEKNIIRLTKSDKNFNSVFEKYILLELPARTLLEIQEAQKKTIHPFIVNPDTLQNDEAFIQAVKILALMEVSNTWTEFEALIMRRKKKIIIKSEDQSELTDFDKILSAMMQVPKPKPGDLKKKPKKGD